MAVWTHKTFFPILMHPQGSHGCQKIRILFLQIKLLSSCAKIAPKRHKLWKLSKLRKKNVEKPCFLRDFRIFFNLGAILAHHTSYGMFSGSWHIFWNPWDPWGSMTSLLTHTVAHFNRPSFRLKTNNQPLKKFLSLAVTWVKVVKNGKILTFKVNFLCQKLSESF